MVSQPFIGPFALLAQRTCFDMQAWDTVCGGRFLSNSYDLGRGSLRIEVSAIAPQVSNGLCVCVNQ
eukprot:3658299-Amphidinium_carterae.2